MKILRSLFLLILYAAAPPVGSGCDLCGCYTPQLEATSPVVSAPLLSWANGSYFAVGEQFTRFATLQLDGNEIANPTGQYLNSSITQVVAGYSINSHVGVQADVPLIYREFKRPGGAAVDQGTVSGLGDVSLLIRAVALHYAAAGGRAFDVSGKNPIAVEPKAGFHRVGSFSRWCETSNWSNRPTKGGVYGNQHSG